MIQEASKYVSTQRMRFGNLQICVSYLPSVRGKRQTTNDRCLDEHSRANAKADGGPQRTVT